MPRLLNPKSSECLYTYIGRGILLVVVFFIFSGFLLKMVSVCLIGIYSSSSEERASDRKRYTQSVSALEDIYSSSSEERASDRKKYTQSVSALEDIYSSSSEERASDKTIVRAGNWLTQSVSIILW